MQMPDVNLLVYAHRAEERTHGAHRAWLERLARGPEPFALSVLVAVAFVRVVTNPRIYPRPTPTALALAAVDQIAAHPGCRLVAPSEDHWSRVASLCRATGDAGSAVTDAQHAALAMAAGCTWVTRDGGFARFAPHGLRWQHLVLAA
jgi:toxin-antitoxin system PIN domain toxin